MKLNSAEAIANVLGCDITDVRENRYQYGRTNIPVFTEGDYYYCATMEDGEPAKHKSIEWQWERCKDIPMNSKKGWIVWKAHMKK